MSDGRVVLLCGGVGGAKVALGLQHILDPGHLAVIVNTGDDFTHLGLRICPDLDTVLYTLGGVADPKRGWGRADETWQFMTQIQQLGGPDWFQLGDQDMAVHVLRTARLSNGATLSAVTADLAQQFKIPSDIIPMSDDPAPTWIVTTEGRLAFQDYFVRHRCEPQVIEVDHREAARARAAPAALATLSAPDLAAILVAPSNPYLSIDPILAVPGLREALASATAPIVAITPLIGANAIKGPTAKIMREIGKEPGLSAIAQHYGTLLDGMLIDRQDAASAARLTIPCASADALMTTLDDRMHVAQAALDLASQLAPRSAE